MALNKRVNELEEKYLLDDSNFIVSFILEGSRFTIINFNNVENWKILEHYIAAKTKFYKLITLNVKFLEMDMDDQIIGTFMKEAFSTAENIFFNTIQDQNGKDEETVPIFRSLLKKEDVIKTIMDILSIIELGMLYGLISVHAEYECDKYKAINKIKEVWSDSDNENDEIIEGIKNLIKILVEHITFKENIELSAMKPINNEVI
jgi:hypothetical protein